MENPNAVLKLHFDKVMGRNPAVLFKNYETYKSSLPVRKIEKLKEPLKLVDLPFFARDEDLQVTMKRLEFQAITTRSLVRYAVSPTCRGKTSCICPAFLMSAARTDDDDRQETKFLHYLYLAFSSNGGKHFFVRNESDISNTKEIAETQGAVFIVECLRKLLNCEEFGPVQIPSEDDTAHMSFEAIAKECQELFDSKINPGRILVHLDEHRKMNEKNPHFRRGALSVIGHDSADRAVVVATYIDIPTEVSSEMSSGACRYAVPVPALDINSALKYAGYSVDPEGLDRNQKRFLATLKFRIASYLSGNMPTFHLAYSFSEQTANNFPIKSIRQVMKIYGDCVNNSIDPRSYRAYWKSERDVGGPGLMSDFLKLTRYYPDSSAIDENVMELVRGVNEPFEFSQRLRGHLVSITFEPEGKARLTYGLQDLVAKVPPQEHDGAPAYETARDKFFTTLMAREVEDLLSGRPLERAYLWALVTMSAVFGAIRSDSFRLVLPRLNIKCRKVESGRIFRDNNIFKDDTVDLSSVDVGWMQQETIYYAREGEPGVSTHPLGDIFFLTTNNELVLIDITASGEGSKAITRKRKHSKRFIDTWRSGRPQGLELVVAHISPLEERRTKISNEYPELRYIYGSDARELLGGLAQFLAWY